jgi:hypothetical protein
MVGTTRKLAAKSSSLYATFAASVFPHICRRLDCARHHGSPQAVLMMPCGFGNCDLCAVAKACPEWAKSDADCQFVRAATIRSHDYLRQEVGKYFGSSVLAAHVQVMLPAWVIGDSSRYMPPPLIWALALAP